MVRWWSGGRVRWWKGEVGEGGVVRCYWTPVLVFYIIELSTVE